MKNYSDVFILSQYKYYTAITSGYRSCREAGTIDYLARSFFIEAQKRNLLGT